MDATAVEQGRRADQGAFGFEWLPAPAVVLDGSGVIVAANAAWRRASETNGGRADRTGVGVNYLEVCERAARTGDEVSARVADGLAEVLDGRRPHFEAEYPCTSPTEQGWFHLHACAAPIGEGGGAVVVHHSLTSWKRLRQQLEREAREDPLTGVLNRRAGLAALERMLASATDVQPFAVLLVDLDEFKAVNDRYGHSTGDDVLETFASRLLAVTREQDLVFRLGGDEFVVVLDESSGLVAEAVAARISESLAVPVGATPSSMCVGVSVGVARYRPGDQASTLLDRADASMYRRKHEAAATYPLVGSRLHARLLDAVGQSVIATDAAGAVIYWNKAAEELFGWRAEEVLGLPIGEVTPADGMQDAAAEIMETLVAGRSFAGEFLLRHRDGTEFPGLVVDTPVFDDTGRLVAVIGVTTDLRERTSRERQLALLSKAVDASADAIVNIDRERRVVTCNSAAGALFGISEGAALGAGALAVGSTLRQAIDAALRGEAVTLTIAELEHPVRGRRTVSASISPILEDDGRAGAVCLIARDISERVREQREADAVRHRLEDAQALAHVGSFEFRFDTGALWWSDEMRRIWGLRPDDDVQLREVLGRVIEQDSPKVERMLRDLEAGRDVDTLLRARSAAGRVVWLHTRARVQGSGPDRRIVGTSYDVTEQKHAEAELASKALLDPLTELPNRAMLDLWLAELARPGGLLPGAALLFVDLDRLKFVNDALGHAGGDRVLRTVAHRLARAARPHRVARIGGDEFVVLAVDLSPDGEDELAQRLLDAVSEPLRAGGHTLQMTASVGVARSDGSVPPALLLRRADLAMYRAKERGRSRSERFDVALQASADRRALVLAALPEAVRNGEITAAFQPIVDLRSGTLAGFEALARWHHAELGTVAPDEFIPIAEEVGLVDRIGDQMLRRGLRAMAGWRKAGLVSQDAFLAVNVSAVQFTDAGLVDRVAEALDELEIPGHVLHVEITETTLMGDADEATRALERFRAMGTKVCIDDFGTGYCSLAYLEQLSVDTVKIDRAFVSALSSDPTDTTIVRAIVGLAHALRLHTVAEGVETEQQRRVLEELGCDLGQGFHWSRPMPVDDATAWLAQRRR